MSTSSRKDEDTAAATDTALDNFIMGLDGEDYVESQEQQRFLASDDASDMSSGDSFEEGSTISMAKMRFAEALQGELENDVADGLLISKEQYDHLRFEDEKIMHLRNAKVLTINPNSSAHPLTFPALVLHRTSRSCTRWPRRS